MPGDRVSDAVEGCVSFGYLSCRITRKVTRASQARNVSTYEVRFRTLGSGADGSLSQRSSALEEISVRVQALVAAAATHPPRLIHSNERASDPAPRIGRPTA